MSDKYDEDWDVILRALRRAENYPREVKQAGDAIEAWGRLREAFPAPTLRSRLAEPTLDPSSRPWCATCTTKGDKVTCDAFACNLPPGAQRPTEYAGPLTEPTQAAPSEDAIASMAAEAIADHGYLANRDDIRRVEHVIQQYIAPLRAALEEAQSNLHAVIGRWETTEKALASERSRREPVPDGDPDTLSALRVADEAERQGLDDPASIALRYLAGSYRCERAARLGSDALLKIERARPAPDTTALRKVLGAGIIDDAVMYADRLLDEAMLLDSPARKDTLRKRANEIMDRAAHAHAILRSEPREES